MGSRCSPASRSRSRSATPRSSRSRGWRTDRSCIRCRPRSPKRAPPSAATARRGCCSPRRRCSTRTRVRRVTRSHRRSAATSAAAPATPPFTKRWREPPSVSELSILGRRLPKVNAWAHLTGTARYADDIDLPRMLYGRLLRSTKAHARIVSVDISRALGLPGVVGVVTGADMPEKMGIMPSPEDETAWAVDKVRYVGEPVAAVAALDEDTAFDALSLIDVVYEDLEPIFTIEEALAREDVKIHDTAKRANVFKEVHLSFGDLEAGFAKADHVREDWFFFEGNTHAPIESHSAVASYDGDGKLTLWTSTQVPHYLHRELEKVLGLPRSRIRVIATPNGGAFGGKSDPFAHELAASLLAMRLRRPVKITPDPGEACSANPRRHPRQMAIKTGVKKDGEITAVEFQSYLDGGAYASYGIATTYYTGALLTVTYRVPAYKFDGVRVYTNKPPCGPKRGHSRGARHLSRGRARRLRRHEPRAGRPWVVFESRDDDGRQRGEGRRSQAPRAAVRCRGDAARRPCRPSERRLSEDLRPKESR